MKHLVKFLFVFVFTLFIPFNHALNAAELDIRSETILRAYEREVERDDEKLILPIYEYLNVDYGDAQTGGFSLHLHGWGRKDLADSELFEDDPDGELIYGYLQYAKPYSKLRVNLGRQHIFAGITNESVDGLRVETGLGPYFTASFFGGLPAAYDGDGAGDGKSVYGARLGHRSGPNYEIGLSYQNRDTDGETNSERAGVDLELLIGSWFAFNGLSSYNVENQDWREHRYTLLLQKGPWAIEPSYQHFQYLDYFDTPDSDNLFAFLKEIDETLTIAGADLLWQGAGMVKLGVRGRSFEYDVREESAQYLAGLLTINFSGGSQIGAEAGRMDGESDENIYDLYRAYFYWMNPFELSPGGFVSGDAFYLAYDAPVFGEDRSVHYSLGAGHTFFDDRLETKLSVNFSQDPYFESDYSSVMTFQIDF